MPGPVQPSNVTGSWSFALADLDLVTTGFLTPHPDVVRYTRRESDYNEIAIQVSNRDDLNVLDGAVYTTVLRSFRNGINRFNGQFVELRETADYWELVAKDPFFNLNWRGIQEVQEFTGVQADDLARTLISDENALQHTHLGAGATAVTPTVTLTTALGNRVSEQIQNLARADDAFFFRINGQDDPTDWATFNCYASSTSKPEVRFEFGNGTMENCDDYLRESLPLVNRAEVVGLKPQLLGIAEATGSYTAHGRWQADRGQVLTENEDLLGSIAAGMITTGPQYTITMSAGPHAPQLFTDFDVGDTVQILIRRAGKTIEGMKRVKEATIILDPDSGTEELESIEVWE